MKVGIVTKGVDLEVHWDDFGEAISIRYVFVVINGMNVDITGKLTEDQLAFIERRIPSKSL